MSAYKYLNALGLATISSLISVNLYAEPPVQAGETLESLSQAKISTTVNGQPASLEQLIQSGQIRLVNAPDATQTPAEQNPTPPSSEQNVPLAPNSESDVTPVPENATPDAKPESSEQLNAPVLHSSAEHPINEQDNVPALEHTIPAADEAVQAVEQANEMIEAPMQAAPSPFDTEIQATE